MVILILLLFLILIVKDKHQQIYHHIDTIQHQIIQNRREVVAPLFHIQHNQLFIK